MAGRRRQVPRWHRQRRRWRWRAAHSFVGTPQNHRRSRAGTITNRLVKVNDGCRLEILACISTSIIIFKLHHGMLRFGELELHDLL